MSIGWASFASVLFLAIGCFVMALRDARMRG